MTEPRGTLEAVARQLAAAAQPLPAALTDLERFQALLLRLGWDARSLPQAYVQLGSRVAEMLEVAAALEEEAGPEQVAAALDEVRRLYLAVRSLDEAPAGVEQGPFLAEFGPRLFELLLVDHLAAELPRVYAVLRLLDVITLEAHEATPGRPAFLHRRFRFEELPKVVTDPRSIPARVYGWGTPELDFTLVANHLYGVFRALGLPATVEEADAVLGRALQAAPEQTTRPISVQLRVPLFGVDVAGVPVEAGLALLELPGETGHQPGVILRPLIPPEIGAVTDLGDGVSFRVRAGSDLATAFGIVVRPGEVAVRFPFQPETPLPSAGFGVALVIAHEEPTPLVGVADGTRLQLGGVTVGLDLDVVAGEPELRATLALVDLLLVISAGDQDGFIGGLLGGDLTVPLPLVISWSSRTGLTFSGSAGLTVAAYPHRELGPVRVEKVAAAVRGGASSGTAELVVTVGVGLSGTLGPIGFTVDGIGLGMRVSFADGNAGPLDVAVGFQPPAGLGLVIDAGPVSGGGTVLTGGGFLSFDSGSGRYAGVVQLSFEQIGITGLGLIETRLPGGAEGYALLVALQATFPAIQVGFGFALTAVGGILAVNRRLDVDALRGRLAAGTAGRILAPQDPVRNAPALLADLDTVFPVAPGVHVIGPTAQLIWVGLVHFDVGVFIELPGPSRVILLGSARATIARPAGGREYLDIRVDVVGVIDLQASTAAFDAVLVDSQLMQVLDLTGGAAFRLSWGDQPYAVLTVGGFHPAYNPEPLTFPPSLTRVAMVHGKPDDRLYLRFEGYFAITTNTMQFGAAVEAIVNAGSWNIRGVLQFDVLIRFEPFRFQADIRASVQVRYKSRTLGGLTLTGSLTGRVPVVLKAKVCIELLFFDICFSDTFTIGSSDTSSVTPVPSALGVLLEELEAPANLHPTEVTDRFVLLRPPLEPVTTTVVSPLGRLVWLQRQAPLDLLLQRIAGVPLRTPQTVRASSPDGTTAERDWFAPGSFADLTDDEALNRRAFERLAGGLRLGAEGAVDGPGRTVPVTVRQIRLPAGAPQEFRAAAFPEWLTRAGFERLGGRISAAAAPAMRVRDEVWTVSDPAGTVATDLSQSQAQQLAMLDPSRARVATPAADPILEMTF